MSKFSIEKRLLIQRYLALNVKRDRIADEVDVHRATRYREINRGFETDTNIDGVPYTVSFDVEVSRGENRYRTHSEDYIDNLFEGDIAVRYDSSVDKKRDSKSSWTERTVPAA